MSFYDDDEVVVPLSCSSYYFDDECHIEEEESVCAICDNGGQLLCCEGICMRSFHATKKDGEHSLCDSLNLTKTQVEADRYYCPNCEHRMHQCFLCKKLGSSDNSLGDAKVFQCVSATCGYFYHPSCVTRQLRLGNDEAKAEAEALERKIVAGEFVCPLHKCRVCGRGEVKSEFNLQFAVCQRCPKSYHRKCLPRAISFEDIDDEDIMVRAWDGLLHNRILIYCEEHEIDEELRTPSRDHIGFPFAEQKKAFLEDKRKILESHLGRDKSRTKFKDHHTCGKTSLKPFVSSFPSSKDEVCTKKHGSVSSVEDNHRKRKELDSSKTAPPQKSQKLKEPCEGGAEEVDDKAGKRKDCDRLFNNIVKPTRLDSTVASKELQSETTTLDNSSQRRLVGTTQEATDSNSTMNVADKTIATANIKENSVQAQGTTTLKKLEEQGSIQANISASILTTEPQRSHESVEPRISNFGNESEIQNTPSAERFFPQFDYGLAASYGFGGGYRMPSYPPFVPYQYPFAPPPPPPSNEMFSYRGFPVVNPSGYSQQYIGRLDPMLAPLPPQDLMDNAIRMQQYQLMSSLPPHPQLQQPSGRNIYDPRGFPLQPTPQHGNSWMGPTGFAPGPNYPYMNRSGGWLED